jgi:hypothetical protein
MTAPNGSPVRLPYPSSDQPWGFFFQSGHYFCRSYGTLSANVLGNSKILIMGDYDQLAALLGRFPNLAMFRSFARLSTKTLLYMQADLIHLEDQLADIEHEDSCSQDQQKNSYKHSWRALSQSPEERGGDIQLRKVEEIRRKIQEYRKYTPHFYRYDDN